MTSCKSEKEDIHLNHKSEILEVKKSKDSLNIELIFNTKGKTGFNLTDKYHYSYYESFSNPSEERDTIARTIFSPHDRQIFYFGNMTRVDGKYKLIKRGFLVDKSEPNIKTIYKDGNIELQKDETGVLDITDFYDEYSYFSSKAPTEDKLSSVNRLDSVYENLNLKISDNISLKEVNDLFYHNHLSLIDPGNQKLDNYVKKSKKPISSALFSVLLYYYIKHRVNSFNYEDLNEKKFPEEYIRNISLGIFNFLRYEENKGDKKYQPAVDWLKKTKLYKNDSVYIKKEITPLDNNQFKDKLTQLTFSNVNEKQFNLQDILKQHPNKYYLIDFWATWCAPCIQGVRTIKKMDMPKNISVISISVDKAKDKEKWVQMTKKLEQSITYWIDETNEETQDFMKFIEVKSIPRYILIDKNMNLIDQAFYHPHEPQFLSKLKDVKNHEYW